MVNYETNYYLFLYLKYSNILNDKEISMATHKLEIIDHYAKQIIAFFDNSIDNGVIYTIKFTDCERLI